MAITSYGKDYLTSIQFPHLKSQISFNYWDLWISIIIENKCNDKKIEMLEEFLKENKKNHHYQTPCEELLSEIASYKEKIKKHQLTPTQIIEAIADSEPDLGFIKQQQKRAVRKILSLNYSPKDKTVAMENTPRKIKSRTAFEGTLHSFWDGEETEAMPGDYRDIFRKKFKKSGFYTKHQTFALEEKLQKNIDKLTKKANTYKLFAIYRGFLTIVIQKTGQIDDSFGNIGELAKNIFHLYIGLDRTILASPKEDFYRDILQLMIWEDYGYFYELYDSFFKEIPTNDIDIVESLLLQEKEVFQELGFEYQEESTLSFLAHLYSYHQQFDKFVKLAEELGTKRWMPIDLLVAAAVKDNKELALAVYEAALKDVDNYHKKSIQKKYEELKNKQ